MKIKEIRVDLEKSLSVNFNSVRLRIGFSSEFEGASLEELDHAVVVQKEHIEKLLDNQILKSVQALPRLKKKAESLSEDIPY